MTQRGSGYGRRSISGMMVRALMAGGLKVRRLREVGAQPMEVVGPSLLRMRWLQPLAPPPFGTSRLLCSCLISFNNSAELGDATIKLIISPLFQRLVLDRARVTNQ